MAKKYSKEPKRAVLLKENEMYKKQTKAYKKIMICALFLCVALCIANLFIIRDQHHKIQKLNHEVKNLMGLRDEYISKTCNNKNALSKLNIVDSYGDDEAYHPKVIYFKDSFNGYKYWMAYSPYPKADDEKENPHIAVSNDMINWQEPDGFKNPLEGTPKDYIRKEVYNSDPHILYNEDTKQLEVWWRYVDNRDYSVIIYRKVSNDGINWSEKEVVIKQNRKKQDYLSPSIIYENGTYRMWYISGRRKFEYVESKDLKEWTDPVRMNLNYSNKELSSWHLDVIHTDIGYEMVISASIKDERNRMNLYYSYSEDNNDWTDPKVILTPSFATDNWDNKGIYRSSILKIDDEYYLFYSGISVSGERGVGLIKGKKITELCYN